LGYRIRKKEKNEGGQKGSRMFAVLGGEISWADNGRASLKKRGLYEQKTGNRHPAWAEPIRGSSRGGPRR